MENQSPNNSGDKEYTAIEPIPMKERNLGFWDMVATWIGSNANNGTWYAGGVVAGCGLAGAAIVTLVANPIAYIIMAAIGFIGYKTGVSTMALMRPAFGVKGSGLPSILNIMQFIGWTAINTFIASISVSYMLQGIFGWPGYGEKGCLFNMVISLIIMNAFNVISVLHGHKSIKIVERIGVFLILGLGIWQTVVIFQNVSLSQIASWTPPAASREKIGTAMDIMAAFSLGWVPAIAEFTRYAKKGSTAVAAPMIGANVALFWFAFVGIIGTISTAITSGTYDPNNSDPSTIVNKLGLGVLALLVIILTSATTNSVNIMTAGISATNIFKKLNPMKSILTCAVISVVVSFVPLCIGSFLDSFTLFMDYIGMAFAPVFGIVLVDYFILHKRKYHTGDIDKKGGLYWFKSGINITAVSVWVISLVIYIFIKKIPFINNVTGAIYPIIVISGILYFIASKIAASNKAQAEHSPQG